MTHNALAVIENSSDLARIFTDGTTDELIEKIEREARSIIPDVSTPKGRGEIKSLAYRIAQGKVILDNAGKNLVSGWKEKAKAVDADRKKVRDRLDALKDEIRKPLTEWEEEQKAIAEAEKLKREIEEAHDQAIMENKLFDAQKELEKKRLEEEERERQRIEKEREEQIRLEAEKKAREEAEAEAQRKIEEEKAAREKAEREKLEAEKRAQEERERAEREKQAAIEEERRKAREESERKEAERIRAEKRAQEEEEKRKEEERKRASRKAHVENINSEVICDLNKIGVDSDLAVKIISAISDGDIRHVSIDYVGGLN